MRHPALPLLLSSLCFATMTIMLKGLAACLPTSELVFFRSSIPCLLLLPGLGLAVRRQGAQTRAALPGLLMRGIAGAIAMFANFGALKHISASGTTVATYTSPVWAAILAAWLWKEATPPRVLVAFPLSFFGVLLMAGGEFLDHPGPETWLGYGMALAAAATAGLAYATVRSLRDLAPTVIVFALCLVGTVLVIPWLVHEYLAPTPAQWGWLLGVGAVGTAGQIFMTLGYRYNTAARASTLSLLTVGATALLAAVFLSERLRLIQWVGMAVLITGTALATSSRRE